MKKNNLRDGDILVLDSVYYRDHTDVHHCYMKVLIGTANNHTDIVTADVQYDSRRQMYDMCTDSASHPNSTLLAHRLMHIGIQHALMDVEDAYSDIIAPIMSTMPCREYPDGSYIDCLDNPAEWDDWID